MNEKSFKDKPRWLYRFDNYKRAFLLLREAIELLETRPLSQLEKEGVIQRFEYTWELAWKVLKDYLEHEGVNFDKITPLSVIRAGLEARIITHGDDWMKALDSRNKMSHIYDFSAFEEVIVQIKRTYLNLFEELHLTLLENSLSS